MLRPAVLRRFSAAVSSSRVCTAPLALTSFRSFSSDGEGSRLPGGKKLRQPWEVPVIETCNFPSLTSLIQVAPNYAMEEERTIEELEEFLLEQEAIGEEEDTLSPDGNQCFFFYHGIQSMLSCRRFSFTNPAPLPQVKSEVLEALELARSLHATAIGRYKCNEHRFPCVLP